MNGSRRRPRFLAGGAILACLLTTSPAWAGEGRPLKSTEGAAQKSTAPLMPAVKPAAARAQLTVQLALEQVRHPWPEDRASSRNVLAALGQKKSELELCGRIARRDGSSVAGFASFEIPAPAGSSPAGSRPPVPRGAITPRTIQLLQSTGFTAELNHCLKQALARVTLPGVKAPVRVRISFGQGSTTTGDTASSYGGLVGSPVGEANVWGTGRLAAAGSTKELVRQAIRERRPQLQSCYREAYRGKTLGSCKAVMTFTIGATGRIEEIRTGSSDCIASLEQCVRAEIQNLRLAPTPSRGKVVVTYPFVFRAEP